jgi:Flp pilus assembly protein TadB
MWRLGRYVFKIADTPSEFEQIHRLNYRTFVSEIPQHADPGTGGVLVDKFHAKSTYFIALRDGRLVGMLSAHDRPPFSVAGRLPDPGVLVQALAGRVQRPLLRLGLATGSGLLAWLLTGWPVGGLLAAGVAAAAPELVGSDRARRQAIARVEAVASWAEMLRDTLAGAAGIEQAITATATAAPLPIRPQVLALAARLERERLPAALAAFADEVADPTCDLVVTALVLASRRQARRLGELLGALAHAAREEATMRLRVEAGRARVRTSARVVVVVTLAMAGGLVVANRGYLAPYDSGLGQLVLAVVGGMFAMALGWLARMGRPEPAVRLLPARPGEQEAMR